MAEQDDPQPGAAEPPTPVLGYSYIQTSDYRSMHTSGVFCGFTLRGEVFLMPYTERPPIPEFVAHALVKQADGSMKMGEEVRDLRREGDDTIREVDCCLMMSPETALSTAKLLQRFAEQVLESRQNRAEGQEVPDGQ